MIRDRAKKREFKNVGESGFDEIIAVIIDKEIKQTNQLEGVLKLRDSGLWIHESVKNVLRKVIPKLSRAE